MIQGKSVSVCSGSGVMGCRELLQAQSDSQAPLRLECDLDDITSWLQSTVPTLERMQQTERAVGVDNLRAEAKDLKVRFRSKCCRSGDQVFIFET